MVQVSSRKVKIEVPRAKRTRKPQRQQQQSQELELLADRNQEGEIAAAVEATAEVATAGQNTATEDSDLETSSDEESWNFAMSAAPNMNSGNGRVQIILTQDVDGNTTGRQLLQAESKAAQMTSMKHPQISITHTLVMHALF